LAILAGDALFSMAFEVASEAPLPKERLVEILRLIAEASGPSGMIGGQVYDLAYEGVVPTQDIVMRIHSMKTAKLITAALLSGAIGAGEKDRLKDLEFIGMNLGLAFQITDDILDEIGDEKKLGKGVKKDRERGKCTYPAVFGIERAKQDARRLANEAKDKVDSVFGKKGRYLKDLADFIVERSY
jgi:geranylgeranyl diphosphate synthase type II